MATAFFSRSALHFNPIQCRKGFSLALFVEQKRYGTNYTFTPVEKSADHYTKYHEVPSDQYWNFVERLRPPATVPTFPKLEVYPSGWTPPADQIPDKPYFVKRNMNHMMPVYLKFEEVRNERKITIIRHIEGDIWALAEELTKYLKEVSKRPAVSQVHEVGMFIKFRGDYVLLVKDWLLKAGF